MALPLRGQKKGRKLAAMVALHMLIGAATLAGLTVALWLIWWPLGLVFGVVSAMFCEELLIAHRSQEPPVSDWEARRKELGY